MSNGSAQKPRNGRGRRAAMPAAPLPSPTTLDAERLIVHATDEDGSPQGTFDIGVLTQRTELLEQLAVAFANTVGPTGPWRRATTCKTGFIAFRHFVAWLTARPDAPTTLAHLTPGMWNDWRLYGTSESARTSMSAAVRGILRNAPEVTQSTRTAIERRIVYPTVSAEAGYSLTELKRLRRHSLTTVRSAAERIQKHLSIAISADPPDPRAEILSDILSSGELGDWASTADARARTLRTLGVRSSRDAYALLFPTRREAVAMSVLLTCDRGWNRSVLNDMTVPVARADAQDGTDEAVFLTDWQKPRSGRSGRHGTSSLAPGSGAESLQLVLDATAAMRLCMRMLGRDAQRLIMYRRDRSGPSRVEAWGLGVPESEAVLEWARSCGVKSDDGSDLRVTMRRIRKTRQVIDREPRQNTRRVHNRTYVMSDPGVKGEAASIVAAGQDYALESAEASLGAKIMGAELLAMIDSDIDQAHSVTGLSKEVLRDLAAGERDTPVAACSDFTLGPKDEPGQPCTASFLTCLECRNAVVTPHHIGRLVYLGEAISTIGSHVGSDLWKRDWAAHWARVRDALDRISTPREQEAARDSLTTEQRSAVDELLRGGFDA